MVAKNIGVKLIMIDTFIKNIKRLYHGFEVSSAKHFISNIKKMNLSIIFNKQ
ncbi:MULTISPECIES: (5-formylfuran-3-yl)methyl phosphate synthase [Proteus]|uniref:(5-formylfuran-3-yl)methyl phosphate synthase n=1 Tax=Proteus TaxID=583 RepID=UPI0034D785D8